MHASVAVAVGYIEIPIPGVDGHMGAAVERVAAHKGDGLAARPKGEQDLAIQGTLADGVIAVVSAEHRLIGRHGKAVGAREDLLTPRTQEVAVAIEDHHGVLTAVEDVDVVLRVHPNRTNFLKRPAIWQ